METLRVRAYNVFFGDAILISIPDRNANGNTTTRRILIDVGNVLSGSGGADRIFEPVIDDIMQQLDGDPLDLYVMTHEHLDHVQGLLWAKHKRGLEIKATHAWLSGSAHPQYYENNLEAKKKRLALVDAYARIALHFRTTAERPRPSVEAMLLNNNPRSTADCVQHLRTVGQKTTYISRATTLEGTHPFEEAEIELWAPEEDTSIYYGHFRPMGLAPAPPALMANDRSISDRSGTEADETQRRPEPLPPPGVDAGAFYDLVARRRRGIFDNLLKIDKAANDSSVVFLLKWRGWRLLFPGDAEERSWKEMNKRNLLEPVHFFKVGHHGSHNGTPTGELLESILPLQAPDDRPRSALVSTHDGTYNNVPDGHTLDELRRRCSVASIGAADDPLFTELEFPDLGA